MLGTGQRRKRRSERCRERFYFTVCSQFLDDCARNSISPHGESPDKATSEYCNLVPKESKKSTRSPPRRWQVGVDRACNSTTPTAKRLLLAETEFAVGKSDECSSYGRQARSP